MTSLETALAEHQQAPPTADIQVTPPSIFEKLNAKAPDEIAKWLNMLIYGDPGAGKTYLGGTAEDSPLTSPVLFIDIDGGVMTIRHRRGIQVVEVRDTDDLIKKFDLIHSSIDTATDTLPFKVCCVDSLTELQKMDMKFIMNVAPGVEKGIQDPSVPSQREWAISQDHIRKIVRGFKDLPCHTIFTAHSSEKPDTKNRMTIGPDLPGKLRNQIAGFVDVLGYLYATEMDGEIVRKVQFAKTDTVLAKDRLGVLGDVVINPTIPMLVEKIGEKNERAGL